MKNDKNRKRNSTLIFKQSTKEVERLNQLVYLTALKKQEYILKRLMGTPMIVFPTPRLRKHLLKELEVIKNQLVELREKGESPDKELLETVEIIKVMVNDMKGEDNESKH